MVTDTIIKKGLPDETSVKVGYKQTELGVLPEDWAVKELGELLGYKQPTNYLVKSSEYSNNHDIPVLTAGKTFILGYTAEETGIFTELPTIIFDDFTTANKYVDFPFKAKSSAMKMLRPKNEIVSLKFIFEKMQLIDFKPGEHKRHWISEYQNLSIAIPKPEEQSAIATVLSDTDALIERLEKLIAKKKAIKQGAMQQLLTGKKRLPGFSGEWETKLFGSSIEVNKGQQLNKSELTATGEYPDWNGGIEPSGYTTKWNMVENTITISEGGNSCGFVNYCKQKFWCGGHCYALKITSANLDKFFLYQLLKFKEKSIMSLRIGSGLPNIQKKNLKEFELFIPKESKEQTTIATILSDMDAEIESLEQKRDKYIILKQGMMQQLLTGRIRIYANN
ncbi:MAG: restriction endonuclease subunit S [Bacteroidetes bacterium]|nr:restriction endonuclease subunit S [Bacteroidota bacterium]